MPAGHELCICLFIKGTVLNQQHLKCIYGDFGAVVGSHLSRCAGVAHSLMRARAAGPKLLPRAGCWPAAALARVLCSSSPPFEADLL